MRIRYERREPRGEDIREIQELKGVIDAQDKDLRHLTEKLREMQMHQVMFSGGDGGDDFEQLQQEQQMQQIQQQLQQQHSPSAMRKMKKPKINCDVIYEEENEDQESQAISA